MGLKDLFSKKKREINNYQDFWEWFVKNERNFYNAVKNKGNIERQFFDHLSPKLNELKDGFFFLVGMLNTGTVDLIITADGAVKNIVFVEELVAAAPKTEGWQFTALKPAMDIKNVSIQMGGYSFTGENLSFYANNDSCYPDEICITVIYDDFNEADEDRITNGVYIFLDNYLGELEFATIVDNLKVTSRRNATAELVPVEKLKSFIAWREKEFIEKYEGTRHNTENDNYSLLEAELKNGNPLIAVVNTDLLDWDAKASHPWILDVEVKFDNSNNGMPDKSTSELLNTIEETLTGRLKDSDGFLNVGRETAEGTRNIYFACKDFRKPAKVSEEIVRAYKSSLSVNYNIYKDKYWQSFNRFKN